jgi:hypothetical protein
MSLSIIVWAGICCLALAVIAYLNWYSLQHVQRATEADTSYRAERSRILATYTHLRSKRLHDPIYYQSSGASERDRH